MGLNDTHFTSPEMTPGEDLEDYRNNVAFRQQLASVFRPHGPHNVRMETGHTILPVTHPEAFGPGGLTGPQVIIHHRSSHWPIALPLGDNPHQWMPNLMKHLNNRDVMKNLHEQMSGPYGDE